MSNSARALTGMRTLEELSRKDTYVHRRHPAAHLLVTLLYVAAVASYGKYELSAMLPLILYPVFLSANGEIPPRVLLRRSLPALPFVLFIGAFNPIFDRRVAAEISGVAISAGWASFLSIALRGFLAVMASLLLISVSGISGVSSALLSLRVPRVLVMQLQMTFRYIHVLGEEAGRISLAYGLRAPDSRAVAMRHWGSLAGEFLLRTLGRAERVHRAMLCRGYTGSLPASKRNAFGVKDLLYMLAWAGFFAAARLVNLPQAIGSLVTGIGG